MWLLLRMWGFNDELLMATLLGGPGDRSSPNATTIIITVIITLKYWHVQGDVEEECF